MARLAADPVAAKAPVGARGPYAKTARRRQDIIDTAISAFADRGYRATSLRDIAEQVGMSLPGMLHHFSSKEVLLAEVLSQRDAITEQLVDGRTAGLDILAALRDIVADNVAQPGLVRLFTNLSAEATDPDHPAHDFFVKRYVTLRARIADGLLLAQRSGEIRADVDLLRVAANLIAMQDGLQVQWLLDESFDMVEAFDSFLVDFRRGLAVQ